MKAIKKLPLWFALLTKRIFARPSFIVLICLVPLLVLGMSIVGVKESGIISIALAQTDPNDPVAKEIIEKLTLDDPLIKFTVYDTPDEACYAAESAKADAAWIFPADMQKRLEAFALAPKEDNFIVTILQREENIALRMANERLCGSLYSYCSKYLYLGYIRENVDGLSHLSDKELYNYYEETWANGDVFEYAYIDEKSTSAEDSNYLTSPIRPLLYIFSVMGGLAASMYYQKDEESGLIARIPRNERFGFEFVSHLLSITYISVISVISLTVSGLSVSLGREIAVAVVFSLASTAMCMLIRRIFTKPEWLAVVAPLFIIVLIAVCPVFINFGSMRPVQILFAPYYAVNAVHSLKHIGYMAIYSAVFTAVNYLIHRVKNRL